MYFYHSFKTLPCVCCHPGGVPPSFHATPEAHVKSVPCPTPVPCPSLYSPTDGHSERYDRCTGTLVPRETPSYVLQRARYGAARRRKAHEADVGRSSSSEGIVARRARGSVRLYTKDFLSHAYRVLAFTRSSVDDSSRVKGSASQTWNITPADHTVSSRRCMTWPSSGTLNIRTWIVYNYIIDMLRSTLHTR
jgi:hypothetical protein